MADRDLRIRVLLDAVDRAFAPLKKIGGGAKTTAAALKATRDRLKELDAAQRDIRSFRELKQQMAASETAMGAAQARAADLARQMAATENPTRKLSAQFKRAREEARALKDRHQEQAVQLQQLRERMSAAGVSVSGLAGHEKRLREEAARTNEELERQQQHLAKVAARSKRMEKAKAAFGKTQALSANMAAGGLSSMGAGAAVGAPVAAAVQQAMTFESAMADVKKVVDFDTPRAFAKMSDDLLDLSTRVPVAKEGLAQILAQAGQAGVANSELLKFTETAAKMGVAFGVLPEEAGQWMATWRTAFGISQDQVTTLADQINYLGNTGPANAPKISEIVTRVGPLGKVAGLASAQVAALGATIAGAGVESEIAATGVKNLMLGLTKGEAATKGQQEAFKALGLDAKQMAEAMQKDAGGAILLVMERLSKLPKEAQAAQLTNLFGSESVAAIAPLLSNLDGLRENMAKVGDATRFAGSMQKEYAGAAGTTAMQLQLLKQRNEAMAAQIGAALLPTVLALSQKLGAAADAVRRFAQEHPKLTAFMAKAAAVLGVLLGVLGGAAIVVAGLLAPFAALAFVAGALGIGLLPLIGIVAAVVAAVAALGVAAYFIVTRWEPIKAWFADLWERIKGFFSGGLLAIAGRILAFSPVGLFLRAFAPVLSFMETLRQKFLEVGAQLIVGLIRGIASKFVELKNAVVGTASAVAGWFKERLGIHSPSRVFAGFGDNTMAGLALGIGRSEREPLDRVKAVAAGMTAAMAMGAASPAGAVIGTAAAQGGGAAAGGGDRYEVHFHPSAGMDERALFQMFERWVADRERGRTARARSSFSDYGD